MGNNETTEDIDCGKEYTDQTANASTINKWTGFQFEHTTDDNDTTDSVSDTHKRSVQLGSDVPDDHVTNKDGQDEDKDSVEEHAVGLRNDTQNHKEDNKTSSSQCRGSEGRPIYVRLIRYLLWITVQMLQVS